MIEEQDLGKYDLAIQSWAKYDEVALEAVNRVIDFRMKFLRQIFHDLGFTGEELEMRTMMYVCYHTWESATFDVSSPRKRARLRKLRLDLLMGK